MLKDINTSEIDKILKSEAEKFEERLKQFKKRNCDV